MKKITVTPEIKKLDTEHGIEMCTYHVEVECMTWEFVLCWKFIDGIGIRHVIPSSAPEAIWKDGPAEIIFRDNITMHMMAIMDAIQIETSPTLQQKILASKYVNGDHDQIMQNIRYILKQKGTILE